MNKTILVLASLAFLAANACSMLPATSSSSSSDSSRSSRDVGEIVGDIPPGSPFSKIALGMPMKQVFDLIGQPTDTRAYVTGKAFIPFYYGSDRTRFDALYKGQGHITFAGASGLTGSSGKVYRVVYDPTEDGYNN